MTSIITTKEIDIEEAIRVMGKMGYELDELGPLTTWLDRGDWVLIFVNHDLGSLSSRILGFAVPWTPGDEFPRHAWDGTWGLGWRYLPEYVVKVAT